MHAIHDQFLSSVLQLKLPTSKSSIDLAESDLKNNDLLELFESQLISRHLDLISRELKEQNLSFYTIGSSGHEGNAAIARAFRHTDLAFLHYRSGAFFVERSRQLPSEDPIQSILLSLMAAKADPISGGRHKVFGSVKLNIPPQTSTIASHLPKAVGAALSIIRAHELKIERTLPDDSVILCSFGDASVNHAVAQAALNAIQWIGYANYPLPIVMICEDNGTGISVPTPAGFIQDIVKSRPVITYLEADGLNLLDVYRVAKEAQQLSRLKHQPVFLHMKCVRLMGHAGSDIETQYLSESQIKVNEANDPLLQSANILIHNNVLTAKDIIAKYQEIAERVKKRAAELKNSEHLSSKKEIMASLLPKRNLKLKPYPSDALRQKIFGNEFSKLSTPRNLNQHINYALTDLLIQYDNMLVFGEDVGKKGGVYRVTADLMKRFGQRRVFDTLLDETTILGTAIGLAHNGFIPIPEIQFLAYFHNAEDQLRGEAATLSYFSSGQYSNPMVIRIPGLAYQKGFGGHFHNDNSLAVFRDIPGIILACPSNGMDAAKMLRTSVAEAYQHGRIVVFIEPIALYMTKDLHQKNDNEWLFTYPNPHEVISLGELGVFGEGKDCVIITYGNGYYLSRQAEKILREKHRIQIKIIDCRWLAPLNVDGILKEIKSYSNVLIVDECRRTGSISEALVTLLVENCKALPNIKRLCAEDCFIPLGTAWEYLLPSRDDIVKAVISLYKK